MNIEELKLILETVSQLGAQGKEAFIWWLVFDNIPSFLIGSGFVGTIYYLISTLKRSAMFGATEEFFMEARDILKTGSPGRLTQMEFNSTKSKLLDIAKESRTR